MAWTAYNLGDLELAKKCLEKPSAATPYGQWVKSKILMRDGKMDDAVALLRELAKTRQIVLFTCHRREKELMKDVSGVRVTEI